MDRPALPIYLGHGQVMKQVVNVHQNEVKQSYKTETTVGLATFLGTFNIYTPARSASQILYSLQAISGA